MTSKPTSSPPEPRPSTMYTPGETSRPVLEINLGSPTAESQDRKNHINSDPYVSPPLFPTKCFWPPYHGRGAKGSRFLGPGLLCSHDNLEQNVSTKNLYLVFWYLCLYLYLFFCPEPHAWDQPLPIWAIAPPQNAWDPTYLQQLDPRYSRFLREK